MCLSMGNVGREAWVSPRGEPNHSIDLSDESAAAMAACRDQIAEVMWANYINVNHDLSYF